MLFQGKTRKGCDYYSQYFRYQSDICVNWFVVVVVSSKRCLEALEASGSGALAIILHVTEHECDHAVGKWYNTVPVIPAIEALVVSLKPYVCRLERQKRLISVMRDYAIALLNL